MLMTFIGKFHPLLVHFPIALVLAAAAAELVVVATPRQTWRTVAVANIRAGAALGCRDGDHRLAARLVAVGRGASVARMASMGGHGGRGGRDRRGAPVVAACTCCRGARPFVYRLTLFATALLVAITGHLGGTLVWGAGFLRP